MSQNCVPRTPTRPSARSVQRTPLSPSIYTGISNVSLSSTTNQSQKKSKSNLVGAADLSNPFLAPISAASRSQSRGTAGGPSSKSRSRNNSPIKRSLSNGTPLNEEYKRQAKGGLIKKGGIEMKMDVVQMDYVAPTKKDDAPTTTASRKDMQRSRSTPGTQRDRFIPSSTSAAGALSSSALTAYSLASAASDAQNPASSLHSDGVGKLSPGHTQRLIEATGLPIGKRILGYHEPPPTAGSGKGGVRLDMQREYVKPLFAKSTSSLPNGTFQAATVKRTIPKVPERVLDAPSMVDDYYLNLLDWSVSGKLAVALEGSVFMWDSDTGSVTQLCTVPNSGAEGGSNYVASVKYSQDGNYLAVGTGEGIIELWDVQVLKRLRCMSGRQGQISSLSWNQHILSAGCGDGSIWHSDVRAGRHKVQELLCHTGEVCGLSWKADGEYLASGGNDNVVCIWDSKMPDPVVGRDAADNAPNSNPKWTKRNHSAAVKAIAWCPWSPNLLASGGGTNDATINVWNAGTGARVHSVKTPSQITSLIWSPTRKEILSTHGYPTNAIMLHAYPSMDRVAEIRDAHDQRVLYTAVSPEGDVVVTGAGDEALKFWRIWESVSSFNKKEKSKKAVENGVGHNSHATSTRSGILSIR